MTRLDYIVSRFPNPTETFVLREMNALEDSGRFEMELLSLFPPKQRFLHPSARRWEARAHRPGVVEALAALLRLAARKPGALIKLLAALVRQTASSPSTLARSLITVPLACAHAERVNRTGVRHLHAHFATFPALAAWICARITEVTFSFTAHANDIYVDDSLLRLTMPEAAFVVTISEFNREMFAAKGLTGSIEVIRAGIFPAEYPYRPRRVPPTGPVKAVCVASMKPHKGHEVLLEALDDPALSRIELDLIGDGELRGQLEETVSRRGLRERVRFLGALDEEAVAAALAEADLFVMSSKVASDGQMEGLPVALMEAVASGVPAIASRLSAIPELVSDGETGLLAEPGDPASLRAAMRYAIEGGADEIDLGEGRRRIEAEFDVGAGAERLTRLLEGTIASGAAP